MADDAAAKAKELLALFRKHQLATYHIQHIALEKGGSAFLANTKGSEIHESIRPLPDDVVIQKHFPNSFRETDLLDRLQSADVSKLVICGAMSHMCIDATTRAAADYGFPCTVIHDACATRNLKFLDTMVPAQQVHASFMSALAFAYAKVRSTEEFLSDFSN